MKRIPLFLIIIFTFLGCDNAQTNKNFNNELQNKEIVADSKSTSIKDLTAKQKKELDSVFSQKDRQLLANAKELEIVDIANKKIVKISDTAKRDLLNALYIDVALGGNSRKSCWKPNYDISTKDKEKSVMFQVSFECESVKGGGADYTLIQGHIDEKNVKSKAIFEQIFQNNK